MNIAFKALDDPTRRKILEMLRKGDLTAGEIADEFHISKPSISHHLDLLNRQGWGSRERKDSLLGIHSTPRCSMISWDGSWALQRSQKKIKDETHQKGLVHLDHHPRAIRVRTCELG